MNKITLKDVKAKAEDIISRIKSYDVALYDAWCELLNCAIDYDNEAQDGEYLNDYLGDLGDYKHLDQWEDEVKHRLNNGSVSSIVCMFANVEGLDDTYYLDGYANLRRATSEHVISDIEQFIKDKLED